MGFFLWGFSALSPKPWTPGGWGREILANRAPEIADISQGAQMLCQVTVPSSTAKPFPLSLLQEVINLGWNGN